LIPRLQRDRSDLSDPRHFIEGPPHQIFAALRERDPVHHNPVGFVGEEFWSLTRWEDIAAASKTPWRFRAREIHFTWVEKAVADPADLATRTGQDPPR